MRKNFKIISVGIVLGLIGLVVGVAYSVRHVAIPVLEPKGPIAAQERHLMIALLLLSLIVVVPVFTLLFVFVWKYRESNTKAKYNPEWDHNRIAETIWWLIPTALILVVGGIIWNSSYQLDPSRALVSSVTPITIQVVALDWKWLFIYPDQHIASINFLQFPTGTPVNFEVTADAPMNSFWIPQLGGQIYAMPGMSTQLHLLASSPGDFTGSSANISGDGFAGMTFVARASSMNDFERWVNNAKLSQSTLSRAQYAQLAQPSQHNAVAYYTADDANLYDSILLKYMTPLSQLPTTATVNPPMSGMVMP